MANHKIKYFLVYFIDYSLYLKKHTLFYWLLVFIRYFSYYNPLKRGVRIALRSKVNDSLITGLRIVDSIEISIGEWLILYMIGKSRWIEKEKWL